MVMSFEKCIDENGTTVYKITGDICTGQCAIALKTVVKAFAPGVLMGKTINAEQLLLSLGKLRSAQQVLMEYNLSVDAICSSQPDHPDMDGRLRLFRHHAEELFTALGYQVQSPTDRIVVIGLDELITSIEHHFRDHIATCRAQISSGFVPFDGLGELFLPGAMVTGVTALGSGAIRAAFLVRSAFFEEKKTLFGKEKCFRLELEYLVAFGQSSATVRFEEVFSGWTGAKTKAVLELPYYPADAAAIVAFTNRGNNCVRMIGNGIESRFVEYFSGGFYPHQQQRRAQVASAATGRVIIDCERGLALGHFPSQGSDEATLAMLNTGNRYKKASGNGSLQNGTRVAEGMLLLDHVPETLRALLWPALVGFSLSTKNWGHVLVESLHEIAFNDKAFDLLVLSHEKKRLIKALVTFGGKATQAKFQDIVSGKAGGSVFLLHGPPGVGKTLTAEAIAEYLHRPLYYVTMGELGTNPEELEKRLGIILDLCASWEALAIIDEADVFLEKRSSGSASDVLRNAMVCVMLRCIEYHQGILFLTTNRVLTFDPAFESRVTVALRYDGLTAAAREQVWRNLIANLTGVVVGKIDYIKLSKEVLNGRQIKNSVRLALALAEDDASSLTHELIEQTMTITSMGRLQMKDVPDF